MNQTAPGAPPTVRVIKDETYPTPKPNTFTFNQPTLIRLLNHAVNDLVVKNPVEVLDVSIRCSGAVVVYEEAEE